MAQKATGKAHREIISVIEIADMFPDNETAEAWFVKNRWPVDHTSPPAFLKGTGL